MLRCLVLVALALGALPAEAGSGPGAGSSRELGRAANQAAEEGAQPAPASNDDEAQVSSSGLFFQSPGALDKLIERLDAATTVHDGTAPQPLHVVQIGDSHTEAGFFSRALGHALAGGRPTSPGFVWPGMLAPGEVEVIAPGRRVWHEESWLDPRAQGPFGPRGVAFTSNRPGAVLELRAKSPLPPGSRVTLYYAPLPGHRSADVRTLDGKMLAHLVAPAEAPASTLGSVELKWPAQATALQLHLADGNTPAEFRFYGFTVERPDAVLSYDTLGAKGTTSEHPLKRDDGALIEYLRQRPPDLLVVWFGTNSAVAKPFSPEFFRESFSGLLTKLREVAPDASLLVIGPPDLNKRPEGCGAWAFQKKRRLYPAEREALKRFACTPEASVINRPGKPPRYPAEGVRTQAEWTQWLESCPFQPLLTLATVADVERDAAVTARGMFFDTYAFMGGPGSMHGWVCQEPRLGEFDHVHLTPEGHAHLAQAVRDALRIRTGSR